MAKIVFNKFLEQRLKAGVPDLSIVGTVVKAALMNSTYDAIADETKRDSHEYFDDVSANEITGPGYTAGGATLANKTVALNTSTNTAKFDADDPSWTSSTLSAHGVLYYISTGTASTSLLLSYHPFATQPTVSTNGAFTVTIDAAGILADSPATGS